MTSASSPSASALPFGPLLRRYRLAAGLSQEALAERARISTRAVSDLERGINRAPRHETLLLLVEALELGPEDRQLLILAARPELMAPDEAFSPPHRARLPQPPTPVIGREEDIQRGLDLLMGSARLVTLTGPGGVGKTRLAVELARRSEAGWRDGAAFIPLADVVDPDLVATELALRLAVRPATHHDMMDLLCDALSGRKMLLVLDNFERVIAAAPLISQLLERAPGLHLLITSRVPLRIRAETVLRVRPLSQDAALALLAERAAAAGVPAPVERATAVQLCRLGDHLPLAIELVAMRLPTHTPALLLDSLSSNVAALGADVRDLPPRQRALSATIDWSYQLLSPREQSLFRCLGVFEGGCRLRDVEAVWGNEQTSGLTLETLSQLVEHSLVQQEEGADLPDGEPRYRMLDTIHGYARHLLQACGEWDARRRAHAERFAALAAASGEIHAGQDSRDAAIWRELPNLRAARAWAHAQGQTHTELIFVTGLGRLLYMEGLSEEALRWTHEVLAPGPGAIETEEDAQLWALACYGAARMLFDAGNLPEAERSCAEGLDMERLHDLNVATAELLCVQGQIAQQRGDEAAAHALFAEALAHARAADNVRGVLTALTGAAQVAMDSGAFDEADAHLREAFALSTRLGFVWATALIHTHLGRLALAQSDFLTSQEHFRAALTKYQQVGNEVYLAWCLEGLAAAALGSGMPARAAWLCGAADGLRESAHAPRPAGEQTGFDRTMAVARASLGEAGFETAWVTGRRATREDMISFALTA